MQTYTTRKWMLDDNFDLYHSQMEIRRIAAIDEKRLQLDSPLVYDHRITSELAPMIHLMRPIRLRTSPESDVRAHALFSGVTDLRSVEFIDMGRTRADLIDPPTNVIGRYPCHAHFSNGFSFSKIAVHASEEGPFASPRHGIVHHSSHGTVTDCVVAGAQSSGFFLEDGDGTGVWKGNVAFIQGSRTHYFGDDNGFGTHEGREVGSAPIGFWIRGLHIEIRHCEVYGFGNSGFAAFVHPVFNADYHAPDSPIRAFDHCIAYGSFLEGMILVQYSHVTNTITNFYRMNLMSTKDGRNGHGLYTIHNAGMEGINSVILGNGSLYGARANNGPNGSLYLQHTIIEGYRQNIDRWPLGVTISDEVVSEPLPSLPETLADVGTTIPVTPVTIEAPEPIVEPVAIEPESDPLPAKTPVTLGGTATVSPLTSAWKPGMPITTNVAMHPQADLAAIANYTVMGSGSLTGISEALDEAIILIPEGIKVIVEGELHLKAFVVDGRLRLADGARLTVGTILIQPSGSLEITGKDIDVAFSGSIEGDPTQSLVGIFSLGSVVMHGERQPNHFTLASGVEQGSTQLQADNAEGWQVGDQLAFPDLQQWTTPKWLLDLDLSLYHMQTELRTIVALEGDLVTLNAPLNYDHLVDDKGPVGHVSRSIRIRTSANSPDRAHALYAGFTRIRNVELIDMGRTTADLIDPATNVIGRYPCHTHFSADFEFERVALHPSNESTYASPRHGFVHHSSVGNITDCLSVSAQSSGFFFEDGDGTGTWERNVAFTSGSKVDYIGDDSHFDLHQAREIGSSPFGLWLRGHQVAMSDCRVYGFGLSGIATFPHARYNRDPQAPEAPLTLLDGCVVYGSSLEGLLRFHYSHATNRVTNFHGTNLAKVKDGRAGEGLKTIQCHTIELFDSVLIGSGALAGADSNGPDGRLVLKNTRIEGFREPWGHWPQGVVIVDPVTN